MQIDRQADVILTNLVLTLQSNQPGTLAAAAVEMGADRPLDVAITISGMHNRGESWDYTHALGPDVQSLHPVKVFSHDFVTLFGVGKYGAADSNYVTSYGEFGDGKDGDLTAVSGQTVLILTTGVLRSVRHRWQDRRRSKLAAARPAHWR